MIASPLATIAVPVGLLRDLEAALLNERRRFEMYPNTDADVSLRLANLDGQIAPIRTELARRRQALGRAGGDE